MIEKNKLKYEERERREGGDEKKERTIYITKTMMILNPNSNLLYTKYA